MIQPEEHEPESVPLVLMVHTATNAQINSAIDKIAKLACVKRPPRLIRVETFSSMNTLHHDRGHHRPLPGSFSRFLMPRR